MTSRLRPAVAGAELGPVFNINFIRPARYAPHIQRWLAGMARWYLLINAVIAVWLTAQATSSYYRHRQAMRAEAQRSGTAAAAPLAHEMARLHQQATEDLASLRALIAWQQSRFPLAGKLAAISTALPARTWITGISGSREGRALTIQASYLIDPEAPYEVPVNGWVESLKSDPRFGRGLQRLELGASSKESQGSAALLRFELIGTADGGKAAQRR